MKRAAMIVELDPAELAIRMCEASYGLKRPFPDPKAALAAMDEECRAGWLRAAVVAMEYLSERVKVGQRADKLPVVGRATLVHDDKEEKVG